MPKPLVYRDECVRTRLAVRLRLRGFDVITAREAGTVGMSDVQQLAYATGRDAILITYNFRHYRALHMRMRPHGGIALINNTNLDWQEMRTAMLIDWAATLPDYRGQLFRWHDLQQHLIGGFLLAGYREDEVRLALGQVRTVTD